MQMLFRKKDTLILPAIMTALCACAGLAHTAAFDELAAMGPAAGYEAQAPSAAARSAALAVSVAPGGDITILTPRPALKQQADPLPDDTVREDRPAAPEELPAPAAAAALNAALNIDPQNLIPADLKADAVKYYLANKGKLGNLRYIGVVDFARHSSFARFYIADTQDGTLNIYHVAHGSGSDPDRDGYATIFSNVVNSNASSLGFYLTGEIYNGKHGRSMRLHGLSATNSNAYERAVVIHAADYVSDNNVQPGRSWGCLAVSNAMLGNVIETLKGGALIYAGLAGAE